MKKSIIYLRISYWWGIIADTVMALLMIFPNLFTRFMKVIPKLSDDFGYGLRYGVPLMIGWTILLFWADRKPIERKEVLLITLFPVVIGYTIFQIFSIQAGYTSMSPTIPVFILQAAMSVMFIYSFHTAKRYEASKGNSSLKKESA